MYGKYYVNRLYIPIPFYCVESSTPLIAKLNSILRMKIMKRNCLISQKRFILLIQRSKNRILQNIEVLQYELSRS